MRVLRQAEFAVVPWKNGGGLTCEICREPAAPAPFDWRLSLATIERSGPFSSFAGYDRTLVLAAGTGIELILPTHVTRLSRIGEMVSFDGDWPAECNLLGGTTRDLNLIAAKDRVQSDSRILELATDEEISTQGWEETLVCTVQGGVVLTNAAGQTLELEPFDVARCNGHDGRITLRPQRSNTAASVPKVFVTTIRHR